MDHPACFSDAAQYGSWLAAAEKAAVAPSGHCTDCTPAYQAQMIAERRCEHPGVTFHEDEDGFIAGRLPIKIRKAA